MARIPMVTRTLKSTVATCLCVNSDNTTAIKDVIMPREYKDLSVLLKKIKKAHDTEEQKIVHIMKVEVRHCRYGISEEKFAEIAEALPDLPEKEEQ